MNNKFINCHSIYKNYQQQIAVDNYDWLPLDLIQFLENKNVASYSNGFFTLVANADYNDIFEYWNLPVNECFLFIKSAFGMFIFYSEKQYWLLDPIANEIIPLGGESDLNFITDTVLCDRIALESTFLINIYEEAIQHLLPPELDECFAFVPAVKLGGSLNATHVKTVKLKEELYILSQL